MKIVFLDIDGVLNGYNKNSFRFVRFCKLCKIEKYMKRFYGFTGVSLYRTFLLALIVKMTGAKVVISSSWRFGWYEPYDEKTKAHKQLYNRLKMFKIPVIGITGKLDLDHSPRSLEILQWLSKHKDSVSTFVILDDEEFDLKSFKGKELIRTSDTERICGRPEENTGLKIKHVFQAIKKLNE